MTPYLDASAWQTSWDRQQEGYLPDREGRLAALLTAVDAVTGGTRPRILDLAGGTGSISLRALRRFPTATTTLLDADPVLRAIAQASFDAAGDLGRRAAVVDADLRASDWVDALPERAYDAVLTSTALHWIETDRLTTLYGEIREVLRPGGVLVNADQMPDDGLPGLTERFGERARLRREALWAAGATLSWDQWWERAAADPVLGPLVEERAKVFSGSHSAEWLPPVSWHLDALRAAGFTEVGLVWRGARDAAVAGVR